jgi:hypothetical protein
MNKVASLRVVVAGAGFKQNPGKLVEGDPVQIERDPDNKVHCNALAVLDKNGDRAGWIPRDIADSLSPKICDGTISVFRTFAESKKSIHIFFYELN